MFCLRVIKEPGCILYYAGSYEYGYMFTQLKNKACTFYNVDDVVDMQKRLSDVIGLDFQIEDWKLC